MAIDYNIKHSQDAQVGIKYEGDGVKFGAALDSTSGDNTAYRRIPMATANKPTFNFQRESRMLSGRGSIKDAGDTLMITKGGTVTMPFDFIATPELLFQHLVMVGQEFNSQGSNVYDVEFDGSSNKTSIGSTLSSGLPHTVNLAYAPTGSGTADGIRVTGAMVSDLSIKGDYGTNGGAITISGNYWSGFSHCTTGDGLAKSQLEQTFDGTWVDPDENVFFHMSDLKTKQLDVDGATDSDMLIKSFEINIVNNVQQLGGDGLGFPEMYVIPQFDITGSLVIKDDAQFDLSAGTNVLQSFFDKTTLSLDLRFGDNTVSTVGEMNILAEIQYTGDPAQDISENGIFWTIPFECVQNSSTEALKISLFSDTAPAAM